MRGPQDGEQGPPGAPEMRDGPDGGRPHPRGPRPASNDDQGPPGREETGVAIVPEVI
jgi:hypothetical protein